jgi:hypothetical protein
MAKKGARRSHGGKTRTKERSQRAAAHAAPAPAHRTSWPQALAERLRKAGIRTTK